MAWSPSPKVADCRAIARKWGDQKQVIIIAIDDAGQIVIATYGDTPSTCKCAEILGNVAFNAIHAHVAALQKGPSPC